MLTSKFSSISVVLWVVFITLFLGFDRTGDNSPTEPKYVNVNTSLTKATLPASLSSTVDIVVDTTSDVADFDGSQQIADLPGPDGVVSLREAIIAANNTAGPQVIGFNIPTSDPGFDGTVFEISPTSELPNFTDGNTTIDGSTQTSFTGNSNAVGPEIVLDGSQAGTAGGLSIVSNDNLIHSVVIINFAAQGLGVFGSNNRVTGCFIGIGPDGATPAGNVFDHGIAIVGSDNIIGGTTPSERNLISNFGVGISLLESATSNVIQGNFIGPDISGSSTTGSGNADGGIAVFGGTANLIGGTSPGAGNLISGNRGGGPMDAAGIFIVTGNDNIIQGNFIGTDVTGSAALANHNGIEIFPGVSGTLVGGQVPGARNVISGNVHDGITVDGGNNLIQGNFIGTDVTGNVALPNERGIQIRGVASNNLVGGSSPNAANVIAFNTGTGVEIRDSGTLAATILKNRIFLNGVLGIDLGPNGADGVTPNDPGDTDSGPNNLMNFPVLTSALATPGKLIVIGTIDTPNPQTATIEFFANPVPSPGEDPSGHGEGAIFLGSNKPNPQGKFTATLPSVAYGTLISATATDANGNTSEFAANIEAKGPEQ